MLRRDPAFLLFRNSHPACLSLPSHQASEIKHRRVRSLLPPFPPSLNSQQSTIHLLFFPRLIEKVSANRSRASVFGIATLNANEKRAPPHRGKSSF
jgi:hypothetical protein